MNFAAGQVVVHPHHGPATIKKIATRTLKNKRVRYLKLEVHPGDLSVSVPSERAEEIGVRALLDVAAVRGIFELLTEPSEATEKVWSRRIKSNADRLRTGDVKIIAALVRDLTRRNEEKRLSFGEMSMLRDARAPLIAELAIVLGVTQEDVETKIDDAILSDVLPELADTALPAAV